MHSETFGYPIFCQTIFCLNFTKKNYETAFKKQDILEINWKVLNSIQVLQTFFLSFQEKPDRQKLPHEYISAIMLHVMTNCLFFQLNKIKLINRRHLYITILIVLKYMLKFQNLLNFGLLYVSQRHHTYYSTM